MSKGNRRDRYTLIALLGALASIVLTSWFSQPDSYEGDNDTKVNAASGQGASINSPLHPRDSFDPWSDTYAQWGMMVLSAVAAFISWKAVVYVRETLEETRRAVSAAEASVSVARQIGNAQLRAYILPFNTELFCMTEPDGAVQRLGVKLTYRNSGQTPGYVFRHDKFVILVPFAERLDRIDWSRFATHPVQHVVPIGSDGTMFFDHDIPIGLLVSTIKENKVIVLYDVIEYRDLAGERHLTSWCAFAKFYGWKIRDGRLFLDGRNDIVESHPHGNEAT